MSFEQGIGGAEFREYFFLGHGFVRSASLARLIRRGRPSINPLKNPPVSA
jgi:hypothetical protein